MDILLKNISKRFGNSWIFKDISFEFRSEKSYAVTGPNGSGKSTLLKIISGGLVPSSGQVVFEGDAHNQIHWSDAATLTSFSAPYIDLIERLTLEELFNFHFKLRKVMDGMDLAGFLTSIDMHAHRNKQIRDFSSGMRQRLKLAFCFYTDSPVILLDEPTSNLDEHWSEWYLKEVKKKTNDHLVIIASNDSKEYTFCDAEFSIPSI